MHRKRLREPRQTSPRLSSASARSNEAGQDSHLLASTTRASNYCSMCSCFVGSGNGSWEQHENGSRHRNIVGNRAGQSVRQAVVPSSYVNGETASREVLKALLSLSGWTPLYHRAAERLNPHLIHAASCGLLHQLTNVSETLTLENCQPAQLACLPQILPRTNISTLELSLPYCTYGPAALAVAAAVSCVANALKECHTLRTLSLRLNAEDYASILRQGGVGTKPLSFLWGQVLQSIQSALQVNLSVRVLQLEAPPGVFHVALLDQLLRSFSRATYNRRLSLLLGRHDRTGANSPIRHLPEAALSQILAAAAPRPPCILSLKLQEWLPTN